jgi:hypothetical protein
MVVFNEDWVGPLVPYPILCVSTHTLVVIMYLVYDMELVNESRLTSKYN